MELTYGGAITMPRNFVPVTEDEMEYIDGGATWNGSAKWGCYKFTFSISNIRQAAASALYAAASLCGIIASGLAAIASFCHGNAVGVIFSAASMVGGFALFGYSLSQLKSYITVTRTIVLPTNRHHR